MNITNRRKDLPPGAEWQVFGWNTMALMMFVVFVAACMGLLAVIVTLLVGATPRP